MTHVNIALAAPQDDASIRQLVKRQAVPGRISIAFEREPDFSLGCAVTGDDCQILVARTKEDAEVVGVACRSIRQVFLNGNEQRLGYLGQLRVDDRFRGRWLVSRGFSLLRQLHENDPVPAYLAAISLRERTRPGLGVIEPCRLILARCVLADSSRDQGLAPGPFPPPQALVLPMP